MDRLHPLRCSFVCLGGARQRHHRRNFRRWLVIFNGVAGTNGSVLLLDYVLYTTDLPNLPTSPLLFFPPPTFAPSYTAGVPSTAAGSVRCSHLAATATGAAIGGSVVLTLLVGLVLGRYRRWKRKRAAAKAPSAAFMRELGTGRVARAERALDSNVSLPVEPALDAADEESRPSEESEPPRAGPSRRRAGNAGVNFGYIERTSHPFDTPAIEEVSRS